MKKKLTLLFIFYINLGLSQNLVLNPSFEDTIPCAIFQNNNYPQMPCTYWFWATGGSVDYFSQQYLCISSAAPNNPAGFQYAKSGIAYCGFSIYNGPVFTAGYREYLEGTLIDTLKQGHAYCVSYYVVKADSGKYYSSDIDLYFSNDSVFDQSTGYELPFTPQIINSNGIIYDTLNWTQISGLYTAQGGEKFITIGNFNNDANTTLDSNIQSNNNAYSYYWIDDVSVIDCTVGLNEIENEKYRISLMPNPAKDKTLYRVTLNKNTNGQVSVFSEFGVQILSYKLFEGENKRFIDLEKLLPGIYILETREKEKIIDRRKLVVIK